MPHKVSVGIVFRRPVISLKFTFGASVNYFAKVNEEKVFKIVVFGRPGSILFL